MEFDDIVYIQDDPGNDINRENLAQPLVFQRFSAIWRTFFLLVQPK